MNFVRILIPALGFHGAPFINGLSLASDLLEKFSAGKSFILGQDTGSDHDATKDLVVVEDGQPAGQSTIISFDRSARIE